jgi:hypothetical protein
MEELVSHTASKPRGGLIRRTSEPLATRPSTAECGIPPRHKLRHLRDIESKTGHSHAHLAAIIGNRTGDSESAPSLPNSLTSNYSPQELRQPRGWFCWQAD